MGNRLFSKAERKQEAVFRKLRHSREIRLYHEPLDYEVPQETKRKATRDAVEDVLDQL